MADGPSGFQLAALRSRVAKQHAAAAAAIDRLQNLNNTVQTALQTSTTDRAQLRTLLTNLTGRVASLETRCTNLETRTTALEAAVAALQAAQPPAGGG